MAGREAKKEALGIIASREVGTAPWSDGTLCQDELAISLCRSNTLMLQGPRRGRILAGLTDRIAIASGDAMECLQTGHDEQL